MITLWGRNNSVNVQKACWVLAETGTPFERIDAGGAFGRLDTDEYGALNPNRRIPALVDGATVLWESNAIVRYVAAKYGADGLWPDDPDTRGIADMWMDWVQTEALPPMGPVFVGLIRTPEADRDLDAIAAGAVQLNDAFARLDGWLAERTYIAGDAFTMGDIPTGAFAWRYLSLDIERPPVPHLTAWFERLRDRPAYAEHVMIPLT